MAVKFLDNIGLGYFWSKIKAWCNATFAAITHNQASNTINAMTGYSKPNSSSAITTSDTLNSAIGKLEKGLENADTTNAVLKNTSNQVTVKEFLFRNVDNDALRIGGGSGRAKGANILLYGKDNENSGRVDFQAYDGTNYSTLKFEPTETRPVFYWLNGYGSGSEQIAYLTDLSGYVPSTRTVNSKALSSNISLTASDVGAAASSHNQASNTINLLTGYSKPNSGSALATTDTLNNALGKLEAKVDTALDDSNYVHKTGNEDIYGIKTFFGDPDNDANVCRVLFRQKDFSRGDAVSDYTYWSIQCLDETNAKWDSTGNGNHGRIGNLQCMLTPGNVVEFALTAYENTYGTDNRGVLAVGYDKANSEAYARAPSTLLTRNASTDILTRDWIPKDTRIVHTSGNETISGAKTFTGEIVGINKDYSTDNANSLYSTTVGSKLTYYTTTNGGTTLTNVPAAINTILESRMIRRISNSDWVVEQICHNSDGLYYRKGRGGTWDAWKTFAFTSDIPSIPNLSLTTSGSGNAITAISVSGHAITATKGTTFLTSHQSLANYVSKTTTSEQFIAGSTVFANGWLNAKNNNMYLNSNPTDSQYSGIWFGDHNNEGIARTLLYFNGSGGNRGYSMYISKKGSSTDYVQIIGGSLVPSTNKYSVTMGSTGCTSFYPNVAGITLGENSTSRRWGQIYSSSTSISTSDERVKDSINTVPEIVLDAWEDVIWYQFKMKESIQEKGIDNARFHNGLIAQQIDNTFKNYNLDVSKYGLFCYDEWEAKEDVLDDENNVLEIGQEGGNLYSVRYEEALCMEAAYQRRKNKILENRISELERQVSDMLQILQSLKGAN